MAAHQAPPSLRFSRHEYWSGLPYPSPGDLPNPDTEPRLPTLQADFFFFGGGAKGNPRILEWVVYPFPRGSSQPKNWTGVSCITGRFFNCSTTKETCHQGGLNLSSACLDIRQSFPNSRALTSFNPWGKITNLDKGKLTNTSDQPPP